MDPKSSATNAASRGNHPSVPQTQVLVPAWEQVDGVVFVTIFRWMFLLFQSWEKLQTCRLCKDDKNHPKFKLLFVCLVDDFLSHGIHHHEAKHHLVGRFLGLFFQPPIKQTLPYFSSWWFCTNASKNSGAFSQTCLVETPRFCHTGEFR